jgi:hypothetical protein
MEGSTAAFGDTDVPEISRFFGIVVQMFYDDHSPPHFHARYGRHQAVIGIRGLTVLKGHLPPRALGLVMEWAAQHGGVADPVPWTVDDESYTDTEQPRFVSDLRRVARAA